MIMSRLFWLLRENDWLTRLSLYIFGVRALFFEWNFYSTHTQHRQLETVKFHDFDGTFEHHFPFICRRKGDSLFCVVVVFSSTHQKEPIRRGLTSNGAVCVCVCLSPRLFNVFPPPIWDRLHFFLFYVERLVVAVQVLKAFQSSGVFFRLMQIEERRVLSNFMKEKEGFFVGWESRLENFKKKRRA